LILERKEIFSLSTAKAVSFFVQKRQSDEIDLEFMLTFLLMRIWSLVVFFSLREERAFLLSLSCLFLVAFFK